jgi:ribosome-binding protein aMBF1 (putative translation factor)
MRKFETFDHFLKEQLKDPEFKKEWDKGELAYQVGREIIKARIASKASQRELARTAKTTQAVISRIENMDESPTIILLQKLAMAMGKKLQIKFV